VFIELAQDFIAKPRRVFTAQRRGAVGAGVIDVQHDFAIQLVRVVTGGVGDAAVEHADGKHGGAAVVAVQQRLDRFVGGEDTGEVGGGRK